MATLERRVGYLEGQVQEQSRTVDGVRDAVGQLAQRVADLEQRMDRRFEGVDRRLDVLDEKISRHFTWVVGIQVTTLVAIVAALLAR